MSAEDSQTWEASSSSLLIFVELQNKDTAPDLDADGVVLLCFFGGSEGALSSY